MPIEAKPSVPDVAHVSPASLLRHSPPAGAQAHHWFCIPGRAITRLIRPHPPSPSGVSCPTKDQASPEPALRWKSSACPSSRAAVKARSQTSLCSKIPLASTRGAACQYQRLKGLNPFPRGTTASAPHEASKAALTESMGTPSRIMADQCWRLGTESNAGACATACCCALRIGIQSAIIHGRSLDSILIFYVRVQPAVFSTAIQTLRAAPKSRLHPRPAIRQH